MNRFLHGMARAVCETFALPGPIVEVGSFQVPGQEHLSDLRRFVPGRRYVGLDLRPGRGVDRLGSVEELPFETGSVGTVFALSTFEHVRHFWRGFDEVRRVLMPGGMFLVCCPFHFQIHNHPSDYWRFTPEALKLLLEPYPHKLVGWHGPPDRPANVWALACNAGHPGLTPAELAAYRGRMAEYAREPLSIFRRLRYRLGRVLCGSRPFAPWLQREAWQVEYVSDRVGRPEGKEAARHASHARTAGRPAPAPAAADDPAHRLGLRRQLELPGGTPPLPGVADVEAAVRPAGGHRRR